ncbi:MAG: hypothetical protein ACJ0DI_09585 [bacterium]
MKKPVHSRLYRQKARLEPLNLEHIVDLQISTQQMIQSKTMYLASIKTYTHNSTLPFFGFSNPKTFHLHIMPPTSVILREAEGEVAESKPLNAE